MIVAQDNAGIYDETDDEEVLMQEGVHSLMYDGTGAGINIPTIV